MPSLMNGRAVRRSSSRVVSSGRPVEPLESRRLLAATLIQDPSDVTGVATTTKAIDLSAFIDDPTVDTKVRFETSLGNIDFQLFDQTKPISVTNFLKYVRQGRYDGTIIHRVTTVQNDGIGVIQGGGFMPYFPSAGSTPQHIPTDAEIQNEASVDPVLLNKKGTISYARTADPNSATSEFFVNTVDNAALDPAQQPPGYAVFGEVINNTLTVAESIAALPTFELGGALQTTPLRNVTPNQQQLLLENYVQLDAYTLPKLTYTVESTNPGVATGTIDGARLKLNYLSAGTTDFTITGTDGAGNTVTAQAFTATVTPAPQLTVNLGGTGNPTSVTFTDADGTLSTISLKGNGTAAVLFDGSNLTQTTAKTKSTVTGTPTGVGSVTVTGGSSATAITVTGKGGNGTISLGALSADSALKSIAAKPANLTGTLSVTGALGKLDLGDVTNGTVSIGGGDAAKPVAITLATSTGGTINSTAPIKSITGNGFVAGNTPGEINAPALDKLTSKGDFAQDLDIAGAVKSVSVTGTLAGAIRGDTIGSVSVKGNVNGAAIVARQAFNAAAKPLGKVTVSGALTNVVISANGNITSVSAASAQTATIFAGISSSASATAIPSQPSDFASAATIGSVTIKGTTADTIVAASTIGKASLGTVTATNDGNPLGLGADSIGSFTATIGTSRLSVKKAETQTDVDAQLSGATSVLGDFRVTAV